MGVICPLHEWPEHDWQDSAKKKLSAVGIDVDYIITGRRKGEVTCSEKKQELYDKSFVKILKIQKKLTEHSS